MADGTDGEGTDVDWTSDLPLGDSGVRTSTRRQLGVIVAIVLGTVVALAVLVTAGAAVFGVIGDRAAQHSASYDFGHDLAEKARDVVTPINPAPDRDWSEVCRYLIDHLGDQLGARPQPFLVDDAISGCSDTLSA